MDNNESFMDIKVILIGDKEGIEEACNCIKYKQIIFKIIVWQEELFINENSNFLQCSDDSIIVIAFKYQVYFIDDVIELVKAVSGVPESLVLNFYALKNYWAGESMLVDKIMNNLSDNESLDGCILGLSHAELGILERRLGLGEFANLAVSGQDLWSNYQILNYCIESYPDKMNGLKYAVIDLFDYSYFGYDLSLAKGYANYIYRGGYRLDQHNFRRNKNYNVSFEQLLKMVEKARKDELTDDQIKLWEMIGEFGHFQMDVPIYNYRKATFRAKIIPDDDVCVIGEYAKKEYSETIAENISCFYGILDGLTGINPNIKLLLITIPRYQKYRDVERPMIDKWKDRFYQIIEEADKKYSFTYVDFTDSDFSYDKNWYKDSAHFNCFGAMKFTDIIREYLLA